MHPGYPIPAWFSLLEPMCIPRNAPVSSRRFESEQPQRRKNLSLYRLKDRFRFHRYFLMSKEKFLDGRAKSH